VKTRHMHGLDLLRVFAAALVVFAHTRDWFGNGLQTWWVDTALSTAVLTPLRMTTLPGSFAIVAFLLVSGVVVTYVAQKETVGRFVARRAVRILPAAWVVLVVVWVLARFGLEPGTAAHPGVGTLFANLTLANFFTGAQGLDPVTWTLVVQITYYLLAAATIPLGRRWPWLPPALMLTLMSILMSLAHSEHTPASHTVRIIATLVPIMVIGQVIALTQLGKLPVLAGLGYATAAWLLLLRGDLTSDFTPAVPAYPQMVVCIALLTIICGRMTGGIAGSGWMKAVAARTYAVFLLHVPVLYLTPHLLSTTAGTTLAFAVSVVGIAVTADLLYRFVEKPTVRWYRRWEKRGPNSAERARDDLAGRVEATR
jgi:exopolysaccharide production protein ExoZ